MAWQLKGNVKGAQGDPGSPGDKGDPGTTTFAELTDVPEFVTGEKPGMRLWIGTQDEYDALGAYDSSTLYAVVG